MQNFGATFAVPGIVAVGPNMRIFGSVNMDVAVQGHLQADVTLANWNVRQTFTDLSRPGPLVTIPRIGLTPRKRPARTPKLPASSGLLMLKGKSRRTSNRRSASASPSTKRWRASTPCEVSLVANGYVQVYITAHADNSGSSKVCYGANTGVSLSAQLHAPPAFGWIMPRNPYILTSWGPVAILQETRPARSEREISISLKPRRPGRWPRSDPQSAWPREGTELSGRSSASRSG